MEPGRRAIESAGSAESQGWTSSDSGTACLSSATHSQGWGFRPTQLWFIQSLEILLLSFNVNVLFILHMKKTAFMPIGV